MRIRLHPIYLSLVGAMGLSACAPKASGDLGSASSEDSEGGDSAADETAGVGSSDSGADGETGEPELCPGAQPINDPTTGEWTGFQRCLDGAIHRVEALACPTPAEPDATCEDELCNPSHPLTDCRIGIDQYDEYAEPYCSQVGRRCNSDADCSEGQICACDGVLEDNIHYGGSWCVSSSCESDADCGEGLRCIIGEHAYEDPCDASRYRTYSACETPTDECLPGWGCAEECSLCRIEGEQWSCVTDSWSAGCPDAGICGRPLFVDQRPSVASVEGRADWGATEATTSLDGEARELLAAHWTRLGLLEHASVASFAKFSCELMAMGAPADLLADAHAAMGDEIEHAKLCFALASRYAGVPVGPGRLPLPRELCVDHDEILAALIREACVEESLSAIDASEAAARSRDPEVRAALEQIAADELRHAQLGWRCLRWMLSKLDLAERTRALALLRQEIDTARRPRLDPVEHDSRLVAHGKMSRHSSRRVRNQAIEEVLIPSLHALEAAEMKRGPGYLVLN